MKKDMSNLIESWKKEEKAHFSGWNFSHLRGKIRGGRVPWYYMRIAKKLVKNSHAVLDMGTGGGEKFSTLGPFPKHTVATEGYKPNVPIARKRLKPLGVKVVECDESGKLPFKKREFDLILNKHSAFDVKEVFRVLRPGGIFLTQQIGADDLKDLRRAFDFCHQSKNTLPNVQKELMKVGFTIKDARDWFGKDRFMTVGALVYFLKVIPWTVDGFSVKKHLKYLLKLQKKIDKGEKLVFTRRWFLVLAQKPEAPLKFTNNL